MSRANELMMSGDPMLTVEGLRKSYANGRRLPVVAVDDLTFSLHTGEVVGLLGPNGAGKTTTLKSLCGLIQPDQGTIRIAGIDLQRHRSMALRHVAALLESTRSLYPRLSPRENLRLMAALHGLSGRQVAGRIEELIRQFALTDYADAQTQALSTGLIRRVALAACLVKDTEVILLDEPTLGLDVHSARELCEMIEGIAATPRRAILVSSHDMHVVERLATRVLIMLNGKLVTNESVSSLIHRFTTRVYRTRTAGLVTAETRHELGRRFPQAVIEDDTNGTLVTLELPDGDEFYQFLDVLRRGGARLDAIARHQPTLEEAFLHVTAARDV